MAQFFVSLEDEIVEAFGEKPAARLRKRYKGSGELTSVPAASLNEASNARSPVVSMVCVAGCTGAAPAGGLRCAAGAGVPPTSPVVQDYNSVRPEVNVGPSLTLGYHFGENALEATGWYLFQNDSFKLDALKGRLDVPFAINNGAPGNPPIPLGFEGNNNLWLQADVVRTSLQTSLGSAEANEAVSV